MTGCPLPIIRKLIFCRKPGKQELNNVLCSEVYFFAPEEIAQPLGVIRTLYEEMFPGVDFSEYLKQREEMDAISYLFRVTAGLESMVLGEDQILGQVRDAFELSRTVGSTGKELNRVVQDAVTCAKKIKTKLRISSI